MIQINENQFALLCFIVLMQNGEGFNNKHPDYIEEKSKMLEAGAMAFHELDIHNMRKVMHWCHLWNVLPPAEVEGYWKKTQECAEELITRGVIV